MSLLRPAAKSGAVWHPHFEEPTSSTEAPPLCLLGVRIYDLFDLKMIACV